MSYIETYKGYEIKIKNEYCHHESPREWDNSSIMFCQHRNYNLGDKSCYEYKPDVAASGHEAFLEYLYDNHASDDVEWDGYDHQVMWRRLERWAENNIIALPLYLYDHSGITMSTGSFSCQWDSGQVGWIFQTKAYLRGLYGVKRISSKLRKRIKSNMTSEVEVYDNYLTGNVYGYEVEGGKVASCGGFYGCDHEASGLLETARAEIDHHIRNLLEQRIKKVKQLIRCRVPLNLRQQELTQ